MTQSEEVQETLEDAISAVSDGVITPAEAIEVGGDVVEVVNDFDSSTIVSDLKQAVINIGSNLFHRIDELRESLFSKDD